MTGDDLRDFVNARLFPYLAGFKQRASGPNTIEYKIGEVISEIKNRLQIGYTLRDVIDRVELSLSTELDGESCSDVQAVRWTKRQAVDFRS